MANELFNRAFAPTTPADANDPPRFGQPSETAKDALVQELRRFLDNANLSAALRAELPTIEKYASFGDGNDPFATTTAILRKLPDRPELLPHVAVSAATGSARPLTIGPPFIGTVQDPPSVTTTLPEPFAFVDGDVLAFRWVDRKKAAHVETFVLTTNRFPAGDPITAATAADLAAEINGQSVRVRAEVVESGGNSYVRFRADGPVAQSEGCHPQELEVDTSSSDNALAATGLGRRGDVTDLGGTPPNATATAPAGAWSAADVGRYVTISSSSRAFFNDGRFPIVGFSTALGTDTLTYTNKYARAEVDSPAAWFIGLRDGPKNTSRPPKHRYAMSWDLTAQVDVFTQDENVRGELSDLVASFFSFFLEDRYFSFYGRTGFDGQTVTREHFQVVLQPPMHNTSESEIPRPNGDGTTKLYANTYSVPLTITQFLDREVYYPGTTTPFVFFGEDLVLDETLPVPGETADGGEA